MLDKEGIAKRIAKEVKDGYYVNLGIGIPTLVANFVRDDIEVEFRSISLAAEIKFLLLFKFKLVCLMFFNLSLRFGIIWYCLC